MNPFQKAQGSQRPVLYLPRPSVAQGVPAATDRGVPPHSSKHCPLAHGLDTVEKVAGEPHTYTRSAWQVKCELQPSALTERGGLLPAIVKRTRQHMSLTVWTGVSQPQHPRRFELGSSVGSEKDEGRGDILCVARCRSSIPGFCLVDASIVAPVATTKNISRLRPRPCSREYAEEGIATPPRDLSDSRFTGFSSLIP